uniref:Uncharacterized protein n=1 Tax=Arundo donax TaxID=35708 RepID=A0A0A9BES8_ARUDO
MGRRARNPAPVRQLIFYDEYGTLTLRTIEIP